jgi:hypothetical protein
VVEEVVALLGQFTERVDERPVPDWWSPWRETARRQLVPEEFSVPPSQRFEG